MCRLLETIKIVNGIPLNLALHEKRLNSSRQKLFGTGESISLSENIQVPEEYRNGILRCRIIYGSSIESVEYTHYSPAAVNTLKLVYADNLKYDLKYLDRNAITSLIDRSLADDILIVRDGYITDSSYANIVFTDGKSWVTPDTPLLHGTMREKLLENGTLTTRTITAKDLNRFSHFRLINAMLEFNSPLLPVANIS